MTPKNIQDACKIIVDHLVKTSPQTLIKDVRLILTFCVTSGVEDFLISDVHIACQNPPEKKLND